tara:strand:+ start:3324 stop:3845 length:522 start_codon:yes stop_codon:yes gene_type:complete
MSKRALTAYLGGLTKKQLQEQVLDLYTRFKPVKTYYNFVFNPKEEKLLDDAKFKIGKEYFPVNTRKPKIRRSVAQKIIKHYLQLGVDAYVIAEVMVYNIEIAQKYTNKKFIKKDTFYVSMFKSFNELLDFVKAHGIETDFIPRIKNIVATTEAQDWFNTIGFDDALEQFNEQR